MTRSKRAAAEQLEAARRLRKLVRPGATVYVAQRHVSSSGMMRVLRLYVVSRGVLVDVTGLACDVAGFTYNTRHQGLSVNGCGMDMHFHAVYSLARSLWPAGHKCTGQASGARACPSNDHSNDYGHLAREYDARHAYDSERASRDLDYRTSYVSARQAWVSEQLETVCYSTKRVHSDAGYALGYRSL